VGTTWASFSRPVKGSTMKSWGTRLAARAGMRKAKVALARKLAVVVGAILVLGAHLVHRAIVRRGHVHRANS
jgi:transposase